MKKFTKKFLLNLTPEEHEWVKQRSKTLGVSMGQIIRQIIDEEKIRDEEARRPAQY